MNCHEAQEKLLDSFERPFAPEEKSQLEAHISTCSECAQFAADHTRLDLRLREGIAAPQLGPWFRVGLRARIARRQREQWPDWLPDVAYFTGAGLAIMSCALLLPLPTVVVLKTGVLVAFVAYSLQTLLTSALGREAD